MDNGSNIICIFTIALLHNFCRREFLCILPPIHVRFVFYRNCSFISAYWQIPRASRSGKHCPSSCIKQSLSHVWNNHPGFDWNGYRILYLSSDNYVLLSVFNSGNVDYTKNSIKFKIVMRGAFQV